MPVNIRGTDDFDTIVIPKVHNLTIATGSHDLPENQDIGARQLVRKLNSTQGIIVVNMPTGETITRAGLTSVPLNGDGDFWLFEKVSLTRWELVDGYETGENSNGTFHRRYDGTEYRHRTYTQLWPIGSTNVEIDSALTDQLLVDTWMVQWGASTGGFTKAGAQSNSAANGWNVSITMDTANTRTIHLTAFGRWYE